MRIPRDIKVIAVVNNKGGVGKTTVSKTIAEYLAIVRGQTTLAIDMDPQCNLSMRYLNMEPEEDPNGSFFPPISSSFSPDDPDMRGWSGRSSTADLFYSMEFGIYPYETQHENLDIIPGHGSKLRDVELVRREEVEAAIVERTRLFLWTEEIAEIYSFVVVDTPPAKSPITRSVLRAATHLVMPTTMDDLGLEGIYGMLRYFQDERLRRGKQDTPLELLGILPNMYRRNTRQAREMRESLLQPEYGVRDYLLENVIGLRTAFEVVNSKDEQPESVFSLPENNIARVEALAACEEIWARMNHG